MDVIEDTVPVNISAIEGESARNVVYSSAAANENVTCILLSNNTDGQVVHQFIQLPTESVLVVGSDQSEESVTYHLPNHDQSTEPPEDLLAADSSHTESTDFEKQLPPPAENTDHNPVYYSQTFCKDCNKIFSSPTKLREHNLSKHKGLFTCGICLRGFKSTYCLKNHTATHKEKQFICCYCDKPFTRASTLREHIKKVHKREEKCLICGRIKEPDHICFKCKTCQASFKTVASFDNHACGRTRLYVCPYCGESFTRNQGLLNHMLNQENKRKFKCVICNDRFNTKAQLRRHERVHTPDQWFRCKLCDKKYATASGFRSHNIKKHKEHKPNSLKPRERLNQRILRKSRPHMRQRDDSVQTNSPIRKTISCQTNDPSSPSSKHETIVTYSTSVSRNQDISTTVSPNRVREFSSSPIRDRDALSPVSDPLSPVSNPLSPASSDRDRDFSSSPGGDRTFVEASVARSATLSPLSDTTYQQVPGLMNCSDDVIITTDARFD